MTFLSYVGTGMRWNIFTKTQRKRHVIVKCPNHKEAQFSDKEKQKRLY